MVTAFQVLFPWFGGKPIIFQSLFSQSQQAMIRGKDKGNILVRGKVDMFEAAIDHQTVA